MPYIGLIGAVNLHADLNRQQANSSHYPVDLPVTALARRASGGLDRHRSKRALCVGSEKQ